MKHFYKIIFTIILFVITQFIMNAQDSTEQISVSKKVGDIIDIKEKKEFHLFNEFTDEEFKEAKFFRNEDKSVYLVIYLNNGTDKKQDISLSEFYTYKERIENKQINYNEIDTTKLCVIELYDESSLSGKIIAITEKNIVVETKYLGNMKIPKKNISDIIVLDTSGKRLNKYWLPNPHDSRHLFAPTARNMPKGEGYFQDIYLLILNANYALTDYITVGGGLSIIPGLGLDQQGYLLNVKTGFDLSEKFSLGGGILYANLPGSDEISTPVIRTVPILNANPPRDTTLTDTTYSNDNYRINAGIAFGVGTYGNRENNITFGMGYAFAEGMDIKNPIYMLGGMARLSRRASFISENWLFFEDHEDGTFAAPIISYGIRFFGEKMSLDFAFLQLPGKKWIDELIFPGIPYVDFVLKF